MLLIRKGQESDLDALVQLYKGLYSTLDSFRLPFSLDSENLKEILAVMLKSKLCCIIVAQCDDNICGFVTASIVRMDRKLKYEGESIMGVIHDIYVTPEFRKKHTATQLLEKAEAWFHDNGIRIVESNILVDNHVSNAFFKKNGYNELARIVYKKL